MPSPWETEDLIRHSEILCRSFEHWLKRPLLPAVGENSLAFGSLSSGSSSSREQAAALFSAPFVVVSHGTQSDPIFNYGNAKALELWELDWADFTALASRQPTKGAEQPERAKMLAKAKAQGYFDGYVGDRTTGSGKRFRMEDGLIWTLLDESGDYYGQAATFSQYHMLD